MPHVLDNPVWHALTGPHEALAVGAGLARHYPRDLAPFSAISELSAAAYADLAAELRTDAEVILFRPDDEAAPDGWETRSARPIVQMLHETAPCLTHHSAVTLRHLTPADSPRMLELADIAKPGPFRSRTGELGPYFGYFEDERLLGMGGVRFLLPEYAELSAISVHPDARGRGVATSIIAALLGNIRQSGRTPFLHVFPANLAITLYQRLGFVERARLWVICRRKIMS